MKRLLIFTLIALLGLATPCYAAFPTEGSPWAMTPEPSADSFDDGFTNNSGGGTLTQHPTFTYCYDLGDGRIGAWFKNQDHAGSSQTAACNVRIDNDSGRTFTAGPSCRHNEGSMANAADQLYLVFVRNADNSQGIQYGQRVNGSTSSEGTSNDSWNFATYYELKLSVTGTGASGTTMYGWLDGTPLNTASVSNVTAGDDSELSSGIAGYSDGQGISADDWWAEAFTPPGGAVGQVISIMMTKIKNWFSKPAYAQGVDVPRYYICPNIGDGSDTNWYRPKIDDVAKDNELSIGYDTEIRMIKQEKGAIPANDWALVRVTATEEEHDVLAADAEVFQLPDKQVSDSLSLAERQEVNMKLQTIGVNTLSINDTHQTLIKRIGAKCLDINEKDYKEKEFLRVK